MAETTIDYTYNYPFASGIDKSAAASRLTVATSKNNEVYPYFFDGRLLRPRVTGQALSLLARIVNSRFYMPPNMVAKILHQLDPVVTSGGGLLRFEGFSACCSAYARVDITPEACQGKINGVGTTNVDFNAQMRAVLASLQDEDRADFAIGPDEVMLKRGFERVIERKVKLPVRWIKGFVEVQAYQSRMELRHIVSKAEALRFLRSLPKSSTNRVVFWVVPSGKGLRLTQLDSGSCLRVGNLERLALLKTIAPICDELRIYSSVDGNSSEWQLVGAGISFSLTLTTEASRGFSGEGQLLHALSLADNKNLATIRSALNWQSVISKSELADHCHIEPSKVSEALAVLGSRGLVGFDSMNKAYFHRHLPFDLELVEDIHPRLKSARQLVDRGDVEVSENSNVQIEGKVKGTDVTHLVNITSETESCTCPWHSKYLGGRGPCKHILALKIASGEIATADLEATI